ncbi:hypothetical protein IE077_002208, partial [Cardiosporidium cionae]
YFSRILFNIIRRTSIYIQLADLDALSGKLTDPSCIIKGTESQGVHLVKEKCISEISMVLENIMEELWCHTLPSKSMGSCYDGELEADLYGLEYKKDSVDSLYPFLPFYIRSYFQSRRLVPTLTYICLELVLRLQWLPFPSYSDLRATSAIASLLVHLLRCEGGLEQLTVCVTTFHLLLVGLHTMGCTMVDQTTTFSSERMASSRRSCGYKESLLLTLSHFSSRWRESPPSITGASALPSREDSGIFLKDILSTIENDFPNILHMAGISSCNALMHMYITELLLSLVSTAMTASSVDPEVFYGIRLLVSFSVILLTQDEFGFFLISCGPILAACAEALSSHSVLPLQDVSYCDISMDEANASPINLEMMLAADHYFREEVLKLHESLRIVFGDATLASCHSDEPSLPSPAALLEACKILEDPCALCLLGDPAQQGQSSISMSVFYHEKGPHHHCERLGGCDGAQWVEFLDIFWGDGTPSADISEDRSTSPTEATATPSNGQTSTSSAQRSGSGSASIGEMSGSFFMQGDKPPPLNAPLSSGGIPVLGALRCLFFYIRRCPTLTLFHGIETELSFLDAAAIEGAAAVISSERGDAFSFESGEMLCDQNIFDADLQRCLSSPPSASLCFDELGHPTSTFYDESTRTLQLPMLGQLSTQMQEKLTTLSKGIGTRLCNKQGMQVLLSLLIRSTSAIHPNLQNSSTQEQWLVDGPLLYDWIASSVNAFPLIKTLLALIFSILHAFSLANMEEAVLGYRNADLLNTLIILTVRLLQCEAPLGRSWGVALFDDDAAQGQRILGIRQCLLWICRIFHLWYSQFPDSQGHLLKSLLRLCSVVPAYTMAGMLLVSACQNLDTVLPSYAHSFHLHFGKQRPICTSGIPEETGEICLSARVRPLLECEAYPFATPLFINNPVYLCCEINLRGGPTPPPMQAAALRKRMRGDPPAFDTPTGDRSRLYDELSAPYTRPMAQTRNSMRLGRLTMGNDGNIFSFPMEDPEAVGEGDEMNLWDVFEERTKLGEELCFTDAFTDGLRPRDMSTPIKSIRHRLLKSERICMEDLSHFLGFVVKSALSSSALLHAIAIQAAGLLASHKIPVYSLLFEFLDNRLQKMQEIATETIEEGKTVILSDNFLESKRRRVPTTDRSKALYQIYNLLEFCSNLISCHAQSYCKSYQDLERLVALPCDRLLRIVPETLFLVKHEFPEDFIHQNLRIAAEIVNYYHRLIRERSGLPITHSLSL